MDFLDAFKKKQNLKPELNKSSIESTLAEIIRVHQPVKVRQLVTMLSNDYSFSVEKKELNSVLYKMKSAGTISINSKFQWTTRGEIAKTKNSPIKRQPVTPIESEVPEIVFTEDQKRIIDLAPTGNLLIRGQAGSGKTTVLAARAGRILSVSGAGSMLFLTYNAALCSYVKKCFKLAKLTRDIQVFTYHQWVKTTVNNLGYPFKGWIDNREKSSVLKKIFENVQQTSPDHRLIQFGKDGNLESWWADEISWMFGYGLRSCADYLDSERVGRGNAIRINTEDRRLIWTVFDLYNQHLQENEIEDYDNAGGLVIKALNSSDGVLPEKMRVDHVFVDEVQDFHQSWLIALSPIPRITLSLAGDLAQKIYKRNFTWKSVGIDIHGSRSIKLAGSHRTTRQVMEVALQFAKNTDLVSSEDYVTPTLPSKNGSKVKRLVRTTVRDAYTDGYEYVVDNFKRLRVKSVAVALPFSRQAYGAQKQLTALGIITSVTKREKLGQVSSGITVTTFHQLKGLEFDHIVLLGLDDQNFPGGFLEKIVDQDTNEEEMSLKRLLYVAMTRAKETLTIVGGDRFCRFLDNIPNSFFEDV